VLIVKVCPPGSLVGVVVVEGAAVVHASYQEDHRQRAHQDQWEDQKGPYGHACERQPDDQNSNAIAYSGRCSRLMRSLLRGSGRHLSVRTRRRLLLPALHREGIKAAV
jgi:hypothetical protein